MKRIHVALLVAAVVLVSGGYAFGMSTAKTIYACVSSSNGSLTKVSTSAPKCPKGTKSLTWNQQGPQGLKGLQGTQGVQGPQGIAGAQGLPGEVSGFFIEAQDIEYRVLLSDTANFRGIKIDGVWWSVLNWDDYEQPFLTFGASQVEGDVLVYKNPTCSGLAQGYLSVYRGRWVETGGGQSYTEQYISPSFGNVAVQIGANYYSASSTNTDITETASYFDGYRCRVGQAPLPERSDDYTPRNLVYDLTPIQKPSLTFDSPLQAR